MRSFWKILFPVLLAMLLSGCAFWMDGSYSSVTPNKAPGTSATDGIIVVASYQQMCDVLTEMVEAGTDSRLLRVRDMTESQMVRNIETAIDYVLRNNAIGAYAVSEVTYEVGTRGGVSAIMLTISYNHNRSEILRIRQLQDMDDVMSRIRIALDNCDTGAVLKVENYKSMDLIQYVEEYVNSNPQKCMEMPQVSVALYPEYGPERVIELTFTYQTERGTLRNMKQTVSDIFMSAQYYVSDDATASEKYAQLYTFLMERFDYTIDTSITPAYSLLRYGVGDSKAFATVYAAMCRQIGLECDTVSGTKAGVALHWNILQIDDVYYHVDLLACSENGTFSIKTAEEMEGYIWDYSEV